MSVERLNDGRWICRYPKGKDPDRPNSNKKYFGRGDEAQYEAEQFNHKLGLGKEPKQYPAFVELVNAYLESKQHSMAATTFENLCIKMENIILPQIGQEQAHRITSDRLDRYVAARSRSVKKTTIHQRSYPR